MVSVFCWVVGRMQLFMHCFFPTYYNNRDPIQMPVLLVTLNVICETNDPYSRKEDVRMFFIVVLHSRRLGIVSVNC